VVDRAGLENRCAREGTVGSNPTLSATQSAGSRRSFMMRWTCGGYRVGTARLVFLVGLLFFRWDWALAEMD
jgi:hypothetical protein